MCMHVLPHASDQEHNIIYYVWNGIAYQETGRFNNSYQLLSTVTNERTASPAEAEEKENEN